MVNTNGPVQVDVSDIFGIGELAKNGAEAFATIVPGHKVVSSARAQIKVEKLLDEGLGYLVEEAKRSGWSEDFLAMRIQGFAESLGRKANLDAVVGYAKATLGRDDPINEDTIRPIDSEWLNYFVDHAERVTDEDIRMVWGAILSGEVNNPGAFSKRTMGTLAAMGRLDVERFRKLCRYIVETPEDKLLALEPDAGGATYNNGGISYEDLSELSAWGLINLYGEAKVQLDPKPGFVCAQDDDYTMRIYSLGEGGVEPRFSIILTRVGRELACMCDERDVRAIVQFLKRRSDRGDFGLTLMKGTDIIDYKELAVTDESEGHEPRSAGSSFSDAMKPISKEELDEICK